MDRVVSDLNLLCDMEPHGAHGSVELNEIVSYKTTDQLQTHLELPLINEEKEVMASEKSQPAVDRKSEGLAAEKSDIPLPHEEAPVEEQFPRLVDRLVKHNIFDPHDVVLRLPFGLTSACRMYLCLSNTLGWALQHFVGSGVFCVYLDDFLKINAGKERSVVSSQNTLLTFGVLDMPLSDKIDMDVEEIIFLGVGFDSRDETLSITEKRKGNIMRMLETWLASVKFKTHELELLAGILSFVTRVIGGLNRNDRSPSSLILDALKQSIPLGCLLIRLFFQVLLVHKPVFSQLTRA